MTTSRETSKPKWLRSITPGRFDLRILEQDVYWHTREGQTLRVEEMSCQHRAATLEMLEMLEAQALNLHLHVMAAAFKDSADAVLGWQTTGDALALNLSGVSIAGSTPVAWLNTMPLVRRIRRLQARDRPTRGS